MYSDDDTNKTPIGSPSLEKSSIYDDVMSNNENSSKPTNDEMIDEKTIENASGKR